MPFSSDEPQSSEFVKTATNPDDQERYLHEAVMLRRAAHPGVVQLLDVETTPHGQVRLTLRRVDGAALADTGPLEDDEVLGLGAAVATTLADLHDIGIVHGDLSADHILVGRDGRPVLCSFGRAAAGHDPAADPSVDVAALAAVLLDRLSPAHPRPRRLLESAARSQGGDPDRLGGRARTLAAALVASSPGARLPGRAQAGPTGSAIPDGSPTGGARPSGPSPTRRHRSGGRRLAGAVVLVAAVAVVAAAAARTVAPTGTRSGRSTAVRPALAAPTGRRPPRRATGPASRRSTAADRPCPAVDDGCRALNVDHGRFVAPAGRFAVGLRDPVIVLGRWTCTPSSLPALLEPATGRIWIWRRWPGRRALPGQAIAVVPGARSLVTEPLPHCDDLGVLRAVGPPLRLTVVTPPPAA